MSGENYFSVDILLYKDINGKIWSGIQSLALSWLDAISFPMYHSSFFHTSFLTPEHKQ